MTRAVVDKAVLKCTEGQGPSVLHVTTKLTLFVDENRIATIFDHIEGSNIPPFKQCKLAPDKQCRASFPAPWQGGFPSLLSSASLEPTFGEDATLECAVGGTVSVDSPGQSALLLNQANKLLDSIALQTSSSEEESGPGIAGALVAIGGTVLAADAAAAPVEGAAGPPGWVVGGAVAIVGGLAIGAGELFGGGKDHSRPAPPPVVVVHSKKDAPGETHAGQATDRFGNPLGPSGKPIAKRVRHPSRKQAREAAQAEGKGPPVHHPSPSREGESPHYHPGDENGEKMPGSAHHDYPK